MSFDISVSGDANISHCSRGETLKHLTARNRLYISERQVRDVTRHQGRHDVVPIISNGTVSSERAASVLESICHSVLVSMLKRVTYACHGRPGCLSDQPWGDSDATCLFSSVAQKTCHLSTHTHFHFPTNTARHNNATWAGKNLQVGTIT